MSKRFGWARDLWKLAKPYWTSEEKWKAWGLLAIILTFTFTSVFIMVKLNMWNQDFFNALQNMDKDAFPKLMMKFAVIAVSYILIVVYKNYLMQLLELNWRRWMTRQMLDQWLARRTYYFWQLTQQASTDNPDQRIAVDVAEFTDTTLSLFIAIVRQVSTLFSFVTILWMLSGPMTLPILGWSIPGYMVWVCLLYSGGGTLVTHWVGRKLIPLNFNSQRFGANFRFALVRLRENGESIALSDGGRFELNYLLGKFTDIYNNFRSIMDKQKQLTFFTVFYDQLANVFPLFIAAPRYFSGAIKLGGLTQISNAFGHVQNSLSFIINAYSTIAHWRSVVQRLAGFQESMEAAALQEKIPREKILTESTKSSLQVHDLNLELPNGIKLASGINLEVPQGKSLLVSGPSGCGKSTFFRTISGIWPFANGRIELPAGMRGMVLPQKPYLPVDTLKSGLTYPEAPKNITDSQIQELMTLCRLGHLIPRLHDIENWSQILSPGEQQRVGFARILIHQPDWLFLDEATSALDEPTQAHLYQTLRTRLPKLTLISIAHRASLKDFHDMHFEMASG